MSDNLHHVNQPQHYSNQYQPQSYYYPPSSTAYYPMYQRRQMAPQPQTGISMQNMLPPEQSYIENILRLNRGKHVTVYMTFNGSKEWTDKTFTGVIEAAGRDHIIISDPETEKRYLLLMVYLDYVVFDEEINYTYPFDTSQQLATYQPR